MYRPAERPDGLNTEFIELYNSNPWPEDIAGFELDGDIRFTFPPQTSVPAQGFVVVAAAPADLEAAQGLVGVYGPYTNSLKTSGAVRLRDEQGSRLLAVDYRSARPWPMGADGTGHSIVLARASYGEADPRAWERSALAGGSPGAANVSPVGALRHVVLNEILAHTDPPQVDSIELYNHSNEPVDLSGCALSDDPRTNRFVLPANTTIAARGFLTFTETELGFALNAAGETVYFKNPDATQVLDALRFDAQGNGVAFGRYPDGAALWSPLSAVTLGDPNAPAYISDVGINEIMYHSISGDDDDQYVELHNHGPSAVDVGGWKFVDGISFVFPAGTVIEPQGYLVVARNAARLLTNYPQLNAQNTLGDFGGRLSGDGERVALAMPESILSTNSFGLTVTNQVDIVVDEVTYGTGGRWGRWADGGGSSLELVDPRADKRLASNWADSDETAKAPWTIIEHTGVLDNGSGARSPMQLGLLDAGECLIDDVEVFADTNGPNYALNQGFNQGVAGLTFRGNHSRSSLVPDAGYPSGGPALHLRTDDGMLTHPNSVELGLSSNPLNTGQTGTLRFKARWLRGCPEPILRFWGCHLEATGRMSIPSNLGTPGLPNSRAVANAGPAIYQVTHSPAVPASGEPVVVTARLSDPDGLASLTLKYRHDLLLTSTNVAMNDAGLDGDAVAGDGLYSATIPGATGQSIPFVLLAGDTAGATSRFPERVDDNAPDRECIVFFGNPTPTNLFGTYHLWLSSSNVTRWKSLPPMSNEDIDGTLVYNNRVIYNMGGRYSGSPWHQNYDGPDGNRACHYIWTMPKDDRLLGASAFNKIHWPGNDIQSYTITNQGDDPTLQREQTAYLFLRALGVPWSYRRFVAVYVNDTRRGMLMEDALRPTGRGVREQYLSGDSGVQLYKLQRWYNGASTSLISECLLRRYATTDGAWKAARYRPVWGLKETPGSLSDFTNVYALITAARAYNLPEYTDILETVADMENWMRVSAANHAVGNWDAFGSYTGQNMAAWMSDEQRWTLFTIDLSICLDNPIAGVGLFWVIDNIWGQILTTPRYRRMYCRALNELVNGVMQPEVIDPILDAKYNAFVAAGLSPTAPTSTKSRIASLRRGIITELVSYTTAPFTVNESTNSTSSNTTVLTGSAPVEVVSVSINGVDYTPDWTAYTSWSLTLPVAAGTNELVVVAYDREENVVGETNVVTVVNTGMPASPVDNVVISEILFNATTPNAEFVELFNRTTNTVFDLSGWRLNGVDYTFPPGSTVAPQRHLVLARSATVFAAMHGALTPVFGEFDGNLQFDGETLSLIKPGAAPEEYVVVDRVRYEAVAPWPVASPANQGTSLQLIDPMQDNSRVSNWAMTPIGSPSEVRATPGELNSVAAPLPAFDALWLNEVQPDNVSGIADNIGEQDPWLELHNSGSSPISLAGYYLGTNTASPLHWMFPSDTTLGPGEFLVIWVDGQPEQSEADHPHTSFRLAPSHGFVALSRIVNSEPQIVDYLSYNNLAGDHSYGDVPDGQPFYRQTMAYATPATTNNAALPPITVFVNEWMADNAGYLYNPATGSADDWFELYNPLGTPAEIGGYFLTDDLSDPFQFEIPAGYQVAPHGFLMVWADGEPGSNATNEPALHVPFKLSKSGESIGLHAPDGTVIDAVTFGPQTGNLSEGRYPDAAGFKRSFSEPSPGGPNVVIEPPPILRLPANPFNATNGFYEFEVQGQPGQVVVIEATTNLVDWHPIHTNLAGMSGPFLFYDLQSGEFPRRYYRARLHQGPLPAPALLGHATGVVEGQFQVAVAAVGGQQVILQSSTNLVDWQSLQTNTVGIGPLLFQDPSITNFTHRFYRALTP